MKKSITNKLILGVIALVVIIGAGFLVFGKHPNSNLGASVYGVTTPTPASSALPVVNVGTSPTPRQICIRSGRFMSAPSITVTSPNGGEVYQPGQQTTVTWTSCNVPASTPINITLNYYANGGLAGSNILSTTVNSGTQIVTLPNAVLFQTGGALQYGANFRIFVSTGSTQLPIPTSDISDNLFSITANQMVVSPNGTPTAVVAMASGSNAHSVVTFTIPFSVTVNGTSPIYIPSNAAESATATAVHAVQYAVDNNGTFTLNGTGTIIYTGNSALTPDVNGNYVIPAGQTKNFNLMVTYQPSAAGSYRASLVNVNWNTNDSASAYNTYTLGLSASAYQTPYVVAQ